MKKIVFSVVYKGMCRDGEYVNYLQRAIDWRLRHERA